MARESNNKTDKKISIKIKRIIFLIIFILFSIVIFFKLSIKKDYKKISENILIDNTLYKEKNQNDLENKIILLSNEIDSIKNKISDLNNRVLIYENNFEDLNKNLNSIQNQDPKLFNKKLNILILIFKIKEFASLGIDFSKELEILVSISKYKKEIYELVLELFNYKNIKSTEKIMDIYLDEIGSIASNNNRHSKFLKFIDSNIKIRKINNIKDTNSIDYVLLNIENSIKKQDYNKALDLINENKLTIFNDTKLNLENNIKFYNIIDKLLMLF